MDMGYFIDNAYYLHGANIIRQIHPCVFLSPLVFSVDRYFTLGLNSPEIISLPTSIFRHPKFVRGCEPKFGVAPKFGGGGAPLARKFRVAKNLGARRFCARSTAPPPYLPHQSAANKGPTAYLPHFRGDKKTQGWICRAAASNGERAGPRRARRLREPAL